MAVDKTTVWLNKLIERGEKVDQCLVLLRTLGSVSLGENKPRELAYTATNDKAKQAKPYGQFKKKKSMCPRLEKNGGRFKTHPKMHILNMEVNKK